jgi:hypothetical protein
MFQFRDLVLSKTFKTERVMFGTVRYITVACRALSPTRPTRPPDELVPVTREAECMVFRPVGDVITTFLAASSVP